MRLKQLLGVLLLLLVFSAVAVAAGSQLTNVSVAAQGNATTVTLQANGAFTHNEYRPADNLLLVDLSGVSAGTLKDRSRALSVPGIASYRVLGYTGATGKQVTRLEVTLTPGAQVNVSEVKAGLQLVLTGTSASAAAPAAKAEEPKLDAKLASKKPAAAPSSSAKAVTVRDISVARGKDGLNIEITATGPLAPKAMKLTGPDRLVVDLPNASPAGRSRAIPVNSAGVKEVRMGRFQSDPPVTRVVVDLAKAQNYDLVANGNKLIVQLHAGSATASAPAEASPVITAHTETAPAPAPESAPAAATPAVADTAAVATAATTDQPAAKPGQQPGPAQDLVVVQAEPKPVDATKPTAAVAESAAKVVENSINATHVGDPGMLPPVSASMQAQPATNLAQQQQQQMAQSAAPAAARYTGEPISVNLKDVDLKDFFRLIHEISGLNVVLDPSVHGSLTLVLDDVPWDQALDIVLKNNSLDKELSGNVLRIAAIDTLRKEAEAVRAQQEAKALAVDKVTVTRFLSYAHSRDVVPTLKKFLSQRGDIISDDRTNGLVISDIPSVIPTLDRLLAQLDRKTQEVEIEARVVSATRNFARDIGTQLGFGWGNKTSAVGGASAVGSSPTQVNNLAPPGPQYIIVGNNQIPLFSNLPVLSPTSGLTLLNATNNYRVDAIITAAESRGLLKILSRPRVVTQNNIQAIIQQGTRIPVVTQAQLGGPPTTTYVDALLRLTVTPQITVEGTIFLNVDVENTTPDFTQQVGGNPTLVTQRATTQVLVTDGGTVVIGGVIQTQNNVTVQQVPWLGDIPGLGNLFKHRSIKTTTQELIFFITPKIIVT